MKFFVAVSLYVGLVACATQAEDFLAQHPDIQVGREALEKAEASHGADTFGLVNKPVDNIVLYQEFDANTKERISAVALVDDQKAEEYYKTYNRDGDAKGEVMERWEEPGLAARQCRRAVGEAQPQGLFARASRCGQFCARGHSCTGDARCPSCRYSLIFLASTLYSKGGLFTSIPPNSSRTRNQQPMAQPTTSTDNAEVQAFLTRHPEILVGREAHEKSEEEAGGDTFSVVNKPFDNVVMYQTFNADTLERVCVAVLIDDQKALDYYKKQNRDDDDDDEPDTKSCPGCGAGSSRAAIEGPERFLIERMVKCRNSMTPPQQ
ncbi:hypothetical protein ACQRIT_004765 [Beauveria bassiana]